MTWTPGSGSLLIWQTPILAKATTYHQPGVSPKIFALGDGTNTPKDPKSSLTPDAPKHLRGVGGVAEPIPNTPCTYGRTLWGATWPARLYSPSPFA